MDSEWECVIVGGGAAGLSAALVLGRARRRTLLVDVGGQSNRAAHGIGGLLGFDGADPDDLYAKGRREVAAYPSVQVRDGEVSGATAGAQYFRVELADGAVETTARLLLATGMRYEYPTLPGIDELWGRSVFHCPFCHGWEVRDQPLAVLAQGERGVHMATLLRGWSDDVTLLTGGPGGLSVEDRTRLDAAGIPVDERVVTELDSADGQLRAVVFGDGSRSPRRGLLVAATLRQRSALAAQLGVKLAATGPASPESIDVDSMYRTSIPGVFAAGDVCTQMPQVAAAVAAGSAAAASVMATIMEQR